MRHWLRKSGWQVLMVLPPLTLWVLMAWDFFMEAWQ